MSDLAALFDRAATAYDAERPLLVPCFDAFYAAALAPLRDLPEGAHVLDLGAGTGLFAGMLAAARPDLSFTLVDLSAAMLDRAAERFAALGVPARTVVADYAREMPEGPFGAVISALSIHHLETPAKAGALRLAHARLAPGAPFVNAEQVAGDTPEEDSALDAAWEVAVLARGATPATVAAARERMAHDRCETVEANLALLRAADFAAPACTFRAGRFAVLAARA